MSLQPFSEEGDFHRFAARVDAGYQCFSVFAQARLQDSPKGGPRANRVRGREGEHKTYCMYNLQLFT